MLRLRPILLSVAFAQTLGEMGPFAQVLKLHAWEPSFEGKIQLLRTEEVVILKKIWWIRAAQIGLWSLSSLAVRDAIPRHKLRARRFAVFHLGVIELRAVVLDDCHYVYRESSLVAKGRSTSRGGLCGALVAQHYQSTAQSPSDYSTLFVHGMC